MDYRYPGRRPWQARGGRTWCERVRDGDGSGGRVWDGEGRVREWLQY